MIAVTGGLGFFLVSGARQVQRSQSVGLEILAGLLPLFLFSMVVIALHLLLIWRGVRVEQVLLPAVALLVALGLIMIWRLRGSEGVWQQMVRGYIPGMLVVIALVLRPRLVENIRQWAVPISAAGLLLTVITAFAGVQDETGSRLALKLGPLPAIQVSEILKLTLIIFLAWYIEREGEAAEGRAMVLPGGFRAPPLRYFLPGALFSGLAILALVKMSDFGAVLIMGVLFVAMLYAGFQTRTFLTVAAIGVVFAALAGVLLATTWSVPDTIRIRYEAFMNPWSSAPVLVNGQPTGVTISAGPGYQIQQSIYAMIAGGVSGSGLGFGYPQFIPLAHSDFIFAAILEEMGSAVGFAILALYGVIFLRLFRTAALLPRTQVFERLLLTGIALHFFAQVIIMIGGTTNLMPLTGVTLPFLSLGGVALLVNLVEIGLALAIVQRLEQDPA
jgi:cell division protein FtsW (lipid II flippase)